MSVPYEPTHWFAYISWLYRMQRGGYRFKGLSEEEWLALGELRDAIENQRENHRQQALLSILARKG